MEKSIYSLTRKIKKQCNFIAFANEHKENYVSLNWMQRGLMGDMDHLIVKIKIWNEGIEYSLNHTVQAVIDWYSTDRHHPMKPVPKPIKDAYWGCYKALFDVAGLPFNFNNQLQQFYNEGEIPEPNINAVVFPKSEAPLIHDAIKAADAIKLLSTPVFNIPTYTAELTRFEKQIKSFCYKILEQYQKGKLSQQLFDKKCLVFKEKNEEAIDDLESEDRESFPDYISSFAAVFGLNQIVF